MDASLIALLAIIASAIQVAILRAIDYYYPKGHTRSGDKIEEEKHRGGDHEQHSDGHEEDSGDQ